MFKNLHEEHNIYAFVFDRRWDSICQGNPAEEWMIPTAFPDLLHRFRTKLQPLGMDTAL